MSNDAYGAIMERIRDGSGPLLIVCHVSPDGDAVGAALAVAHYCESVGRAFVVVNDDPVPSRYDFMPLADRFLRTTDVSLRFAQVIAVDCADARRMGQTTLLFAPDYELINIDHHDTNDGYGHLNVVDPQAAATCLVLYRMMHTLHVPIGRAMATCLYTGIVFDTGGFRYNNSTPEIHLAAADLLTRGIEPFYIADRVLEAMTKEQVELVRLGLSTLVVDSSGRMAYVAVDQAMLSASGATDDDTEALLPYTRSLSGVEVGILFRERTDHSVKVSLRSRERVDVAAIAVSFGGGGHVRAAGCNLEGPLADAIAQVTDQVRKAVSAAFAQ